MPPSQEISVIAGTAVGVILLLALALTLLICGYCNRKTCDHEEGLQPDVELGNIQNPRGSSIWFARDSVPELRCGQTLHLPPMPASEPGYRASSIQEKLPTLVPVAISEEHDATVAESLSTETCSTGSGDGSAMGEGMAPAEEQGEGDQAVVVVKEELTD
ncbi:hypothetical protein B9Z19DRAFT_1118584 [Tuber borchii]|uniref:Uncharacterized protein n=1 Tax=Tuber borchii TaxID=42251 RepID=A0A2T7A821_TUBBO|nr:hypothetical protein B9Z19DRAFT_1118584 [Tuber borchii]